MLRTAAEAEVITTLTDLEQIYKKEFKHFQKNATKDNYWGDHLQSKKSKLEAIQMMISAFKLLKED